MQQECPRQELNLVLDLRRVACESGTLQGLFAQKPSFQPSEETLFAVPMFAGKSRQRRQIDDERERQLEVAQEPGIGGNHLAALPLGEGHVETIVDAMPGLDGDGDGPRKERSEANCLTSGCKSRRRRSPCGAVVISGSLRGDSWAGSPDV